MNISFFDANSLHAYGVALITVAVALVVFAILQRVVIGRLARGAERSKNRIDDAVVAMLRSVRPPFYWYLSIYIGLRTLALPSIFVAVINGLLLAWVLYYAVRASSVAIDMFLSRGGGGDEQAARNLLGGIAKAALWAVALLLFLSNLGINITSLIAGLGIGGVAVAFALQNILADLFSSFAIYFDKPFEVGDFIVVGDQMGTVKKIGIKTTRLTALQGEEIIVSNRELTSAHIQNFKKMRERRIQADFGIIYETPRELVIALPGKIRAAIEQLPGIRVDRVHFAGFGDSALMFELVYYVTSGDYNEYMDRQQSINLTLLELFAKEKVSFAYPTRFVYTAKAD